MAGDAGDGLAGKRLLVTGSSAGIGHAIARQLADGDAIVGVCSRDPIAAESAAAAIGGRCIPLAADLALPDGAERLVAAFVAETGGIDGLVNSAGVAFFAAAADFTRAQWREVLDLNISGLFFASQAAASAMSDGGVIVNLASISGFRGMHGRAAYATTKAGIIGLTRVLAIEWAPEIRVMCVAPGPVETEMTMQHVRSGAVNVDQIRSRTPLQRMSSPDEIAEVVCFLLGDRASFMTGSTVAVDGGWLASGAPDTIPFTAASPTDSSETATVSS